MKRSCPRLIVAALRGGAGKTTLSVAMTVALCKQGITVTPFKKGPDYIDAAWLSKAASRPAYNLDTYLMGSEQVVQSFSRHAAKDGVSIIEGNRGLFDGVNAAGEFSTAELAKLLQAPVILVVDCDKVTRTAAAMVLGCMHLDSGVDIRGVILSRVSGNRHASVIRRSIEEYTGLAVYGVVPRLPDLPFVQRYLGLIPPEEDERVQLALEKAGAVARNYLDIPGLLGVAQSAPSWKIGAFPKPDKSRSAPHESVTIGVIKDAAFQFYYEENIEALTDRGANVIQISALDEKVLPPVDALYIGGGFPETQAGRLAQNESFRRSLKEAAEKGLPIYAECGGFIYLGESLTIGDHHYPMAGALPVTFGLENRPQGHGYTVLAVDRENPFFPVGTTISGHEFHYCRILSQRDEETHTAFNVLKGTGLNGQREGLCRKNILAGFTHLHALGIPEWAVALMDRAREYRQTKRNQGPVLVGDGFDAAPNRRTG
ncbi:MAG: cobyrinate a,c-diamide synthase [Deltaproteobacteria bacterium]|nr:MAG: cobyrinate a,c-diamide synthase [Deltaproteobacteria bacterium]